MHLWFQLDLTEITRDKELLIDFQVKSFGLILLLREFALIFDIAGTSITRLTIIEA